MVYFNTLLLQHFMSTSTDTHFKKQIIGAVWVGPMNERIDCLPNPYKKCDSYFIFLAISEGKAFGIFFILLI